MLITQFETLIQRQLAAGIPLNSTLPKGMSEQDIQSIEALLEEKLPEEVLTLFQYANGQHPKDDIGVLFNMVYCNANSIVKALNFSRSLIQPVQNQILHPEKSQAILDQIITCCQETLFQKQLQAPANTWHHIEFSFGEANISGPRIYTSPTQESDLPLSWEGDIFASPIFTLLEDLLRLERADYAWDELKVTITYPKQFHIEREFYDFDQELPLTSTPEQHIKCKYFHYKWLPLFTDGGSNYIGIDLDPDTKGTKGQVIVFGRDEEDMQVFAPSLSVFFARLIQQLEQQQSALIPIQYLLQDTLREHWS